jgi:hypothetical protein
MYYSILLLASYVLMWDLRKGIKTNKGRNISDFQYIFQHICLCYTEKLSNYIVYNFQFEFNNDEMICIVLCINNIDNRIRKLALAQITLPRSCSNNTSSPLVRARWRARSWVQDPTGSMCNFPIKKNKK